MEKMAQPQQPVSDLISASACNVGLTPEILTEVFLQGVFRGEFERSAEGWPSNRDEDLAISIRYPMPQIESESGKHLIYENYPVSSWSLLDWLRGHNAAPNNITRNTIVNHTSSKTQQRNLLTALGDVRREEFPPNTQELTKKIFVDPEYFKNWISIRFKKFSREKTFLVNKKEQNIHKMSDIDFLKNFKDRLKNNGARIVYEKSKYEHRYFWSIFEKTYKEFIGTEKTFPADTEYATMIKENFLLCYEHGTIRKKVFEWT